MPKPTILFALDPHSAAFCSAIQRQFQKLDSPQCCLIQTYQNLHELATSAKNLTRYERKLLDNLLSSYNPLN